MLENMFRISQVHLLILQMIIQMNSELQIKLWSNQFLTKIVKTVESDKVTVRNNGLPNIREICSGYLKHGIIKFLTRFVREFMYSGIYFLFTVSHTLPISFRN